MAATTRATITFFMSMLHLENMTNILGSGTFGQVAKCRNVNTGEWVGVKVIKNKPAYLKQSMIESKILLELNSIWDPEDSHHLLRLLDTFTHKQHLCLVLELLSENLYEVIKQNHFRGLSINLVRNFSEQLLDALVVLKEANIIHCDLKPENILLKSTEPPTIKVIDFGSACYEPEQTYTYIQSRFYRSPEVLLGLQYTTAIDMWSFGCIVAELFLGMPIFPGSSEYNQLYRIIETLGVPPDHMVKRGKYGKRYFNRNDTRDPISYSLKDRAQYAKEQGKIEKSSKRYFRTTDLTEMIMQSPMPRKHMSTEEKEKEMASRVDMLDFLKRLLVLDPLQRLTPQEAKRHPFITGLHQREDKIPYKCVYNSVSNPILGAPPPSPAAENDEPFCKSTATKDMRPSNSPQACDNNLRRRQHFASAQYAGDEDIVIH
ncbi:dual specificity protein kinase yak1 [Apophysomyces sp. BC1034]|nr:dual specificity protein kinase yak1 [Apophysomyces sp. BC1034]